MLDDASVCGLSADHRMEHVCGSAAAEAKSPEPHQGDAAGGELKRARLSQRLQARAAAAPPAAGHAAAEAGDGGPASTTPAGASTTGGTRRHRSKAAKPSGMTLEEEQAWRQRLLDAHAQFRREVQQRPLWMEVDVGGAVAPAAVAGRTVRVLWDDGVWYLASVASYNGATGEHHLSYDDGTEEEAALAGDRVRLLLHAREALQPPMPAELRAYAGRLAERAEQPKHKEQAASLQRKAGQLRALAEAREREAAKAAAAAQAAAAVVGAKATKSAADTGAAGGAGHGEATKAAMDVDLDRATQLEEQQQQQGQEAQSSKPESAEAPAALQRVSHQACLEHKQQQEEEKEEEEAGVEATMSCQAGRVPVTAAHASAGAASATQGTGRSLPAGASYATPSPCSSSGQKPVGGRYSAGGEAGAGEGAAEAPPTAAAASTAEGQPSQREEEDEEGAVQGPLLPGEVVWCKVAGFPDWPALVITHEQAANNGVNGALSSLNLKRVPMWFFGDYSSSINAQKDVTRFAEGVRRGFHTRKSIRRNHFRRSMFEVESYCKEGELPPGMVPQHGDEEVEEGQEERVDPASKGGKAAGKAAGKAMSTKRKSGAAAAVAAALTSAAAGGGAVLQPNRQLRVLSLGRVEWLHPAFHDEKHIWPVGYTAERLAVTPASGGREVPHLMEVLEASDGSGPLFRITPEGGACVQASKPTKAWLLLFAGDKRGGAKTAGLSGPKMFGLGLAAVQRAVEKLPGVERCERYCWPDEQERPPRPELTCTEWRRRLRCEALMQMLVEGVAPVALAPTPPGVCHVCNEEDELEDNVVLQCDRCRVFVHMDCYGVAEAPNGAPWYCDVCSLGLAAPPPCALCPLAGGALKRTTCGRWCHVACAAWAEEMSVDPGAPCHGVLRGLIQGLGAVHRSRFNITCGLCKQPHGACVQCCDPRCYAAFHPLCARQAADCVTEMVEDSDCEEGEEGVAADENDAAADNRQQARGRGKRPRKEGYSTGSHRLLAFCRKHAGQRSSGSGLHQRAGGEPALAPPLPRAAVAAKSRGGGGCEVGRSAVEAEANGPSDSSAQPSATAGPAASGQEGQHAPAPALPSLTAEQVFANPEGCARCLPYNFALRRGQRAPEAVAAAQAKRLFVRSVPYLVGGPKQQAPPEVPPSTCTRLAPVVCREGGRQEEGDGSPEDEQQQQQEEGVLQQEQPQGEGAAGGREPASPPAAPAQALKAALPPLPLSPGAPQAASQAERFAEMRRTLGERVTCGKSGIHGWGAFAKRPHHEGDMVIEYVGDLVRPSVADMRERVCYDRVVGAGTYIFRLNATQCVDATRAGNMAHLLNHSCDPNCYSRTIGVADPGADVKCSDHVVILARRDIAAGEELTYDYRFCGEEQLRCNCGAAACRGRVNEALRAGEVQRAPRSRLRPYLSLARPQLTAAAQQAGGQPAGQEEAAPQRAAQQPGSQAVAPGDNSQEGEQVGEPTQAVEQRQDSQAAEMPPSQQQQARGVEQQDSRHAGPAQQQQQQLVGPLEHPPQQPEGQVQQPGCEPMLGDAAGRQLDAQLGGAEVEHQDGTQEERHPLACLLEAYQSGAEDTEREEEGD